MDINFLSISYYMSFCQYKDLLGKPNEGIHKYRFLGFAIMDIIFTIFGGIILSKMFGINVYKITISLFIIGILMHRIFCVRTTIDKLFF